MKSVIKNVLLCITLSIAVPQHISAATYPLSQESSDHVALVAVIGALVTGGIGYLIATLNDDSPVYALDVKSKSILIASLAAIGALSTGLYSYYNTPEKTLEWAERVLANLDNNQLRQVVTAAEGQSEEDAAQAIKAVYVFDRYPAVSAVYGLTWLHSSYANLMSHLSQVSDCHIAPLCQKAHTHLAALCSSQEALKKAIALIKSNGGYVKELSAKQYADYTCQMVQHQAAIAQAAWVQATKPDRPPVNVIHQAPPQVVIVNR